MTSCTNCNATLSGDDRFCPECGAERPPEMKTLSGLETLDPDADKIKAVPELEPGMEFAGRYTIESVIGRGGMGVVYCAHDKLAEKQVALKLIRADRLAGQGAVKRLISEGITARDIRHQNIVAVYDVGEANGQPFVSMEYLKGKSLRDWHREKIRRREDVPLRIAARIVAETLDGLAAAHAAGVIHRDLKPENIMLSGEPSETEAPIKILDFGIARATRGNDSATGTGLGTPRYMAPEQVTNADSAGAEADLYSLSVIFYELLVDVLPQGHWQPPSGGRSDVPKAIDVLIERGLSNRPANRPASAKEYRKLLVDAVNMTGGDSPRRKVVDEVIERANKSAGGSYLKKLMFWSGITAAAVIVIGALSVMDIEDAGDTYDPAPYQPSRYGPDPYDPPPFDPAPVPVERSPYEKLSGNWDDGGGSFYSVRFDSSGNFSGNGRSNNGYQLQIQGKFSGASGTFDVAAPAAGITLSGRMQWDRQCHVSFQTYDPNGILVNQGQMHVNHAPGAPCP